MTRRLSTAIAAAILLGTSLAGCQTESASRAAPAPTAAFPQIVRQGGTEYLQLRQGDVPGLTWSEVKQVDLPAVLETTGQVTFDDRRVSTIVSRVQGRIEDTRVSRWDSVRRGQPIVQLYSPDFMTAEAEYLQALQTSRISANAGVQGSTDIAASMVSAAKRKLELLGMEAADIAALKTPSPTVWIRAPISGTVVENKAVRGSAVNPGDVLYTLGTLDPVWITADIYEDDLSRVRVGQQLEAVTTAFPQETFKGLIARISPDVNPDTHTLQIRCEVRNRAGVLKPQMLARVKIITQAGSALVMPQEALVFETDAYYAFVDTGGGRVERRKVAVGSWSQQGLARVIAGLKAGERVVTRESIQVNALWHQAQGESS
jgi:Cu(I)/Ag(I) efflux system membrane fusion protein